MKQIPARDELMKRRGAYVANAIDELVLAVVPVLLGEGERPFGGVDDPGWSRSRSRTLWLRAVPVVGVWPRRAGGVDLCELPHLAGDGEQVVRGVKRLLDGV